MKEMFSCGFNTRKETNNNDKQLLCSDMKAAYQPRHYLKNVRNKGYISDAGIWM